MPLYPTDKKVIGLDPCNTWPVGSRVFQNPTKAAKAMAFSHGGTENTEKIFGLLQQILRVLRGSV